MNRRIMRLIVFFDLPTQTDKDLIEYRKFRNFLIKNGFIMMQKSVYSKLVLNNNSSNLLKKQVYKNIPKDGLVQLLQITEKQYSSIEYLIGSSQNKIIDNNKRILEI